jgi:hypothetical protein
MSEDAGEDSGDKPGDGLGEGVVGAEALKCESVVD